MHQAQSRQVALPAFANAREARPLWKVDDFLQQPEQAHFVVGFPALQAVDQRDGGDLRDHGVEGLLQCRMLSLVLVQQPCQALQVVLDAVMHLAHQRVALLVGFGQALRLGLPAFADVA